MMTDIKQKDLIKKIEKAGFDFIRNSKHIIYKKNEIIIAIPHCKTIKRNTHKHIQKLIESA